MTDAVHDQHWRLAARDHDRIVATGPAVSSPPVPNFFAEVMFIQKNRPRTTVAEPIGETLRRTRQARVSARFRTRLAARPARGSTGQKGSIFPEHLLDFLGVVRLR